MNLSNPIRNFNSANQENLLPGFGSAHLFPPDSSFHTKSSLQLRLKSKSIWGFPKMVGFPNKPIGFPTKNDHFGVFWRYHHFRKHHINLV